MMDENYIILPMSSLDVDTIGIRVGTENAIEMAIKASLDSPNTAHGVYLRTGTEWKLVGIAYEGKFKPAEGTETEA